VEKVKYDDFEGHGGAVSLRDPVKTPNEWERWKPEVKI
jgi:hypothetical protein